MFSIEDIFILLSLFALGLWALLWPHPILRIGVATIYFFIIAFAMVDYEAGARSVISRHKPWTAEFKSGVSAMLGSISTLRPYILVAAVGLFALAMKGQRPPRDHNEGNRK